MKIISFNVNGLRAICKKNFLNDFNSLNADIFCLQETKLQKGQEPFELEGYYSFWNYAIQKGYSGTAIFTKEKPQNAFNGIGIEKFDTEGRVITLEYEKFFIINVYTPNSQPELKRLEYRMMWEDAFFNYINSLKKPVIFCGDLNVAHEEIDLKNPNTNHNNPGFSDEERGKMTRLLANGYKDTFREMHPTSVKYSWWSYRMNAREKNVGWRIDYFIVSKDIMPLVIDSKILNEIYGSDHCPIELDIKL
ncbi:MAG: exodeoxyribonuclease III [Eubacteriales bacterium]|nr:exodeoxyribonuclease III [Eubacteriales bacterium]